MRLLRGGLLPIALALAACGGGGGAHAGGAAPLPAATATPPAIAGPTTYDVDSAPAASQVALDARILGTTPIAVTPAYSNSAHVISIVPPAPGLPLRITLAENGAKRHRALVYNMLADVSSAAVLDASTTASSFARAPAGLRRMPRLAGSAPASHQLYVTTARGSAPSDALRRTSGVTDLAAPVLTRRLGGETRLLTIDPAADLDTVARSVRAAPGIVRVDRPAPRWALSANPAPNDPYYETADQWDLFVIHAAGAWAYSLGDPQVQVAVIDTGADLSNADLLNKVTIYESVTGGTIKGGSGSVADHDGHGTNVAGIAGDQTDNKFGFASTGYRTGLQVYRIFDSTGPGTASSADEVIAIQEAVRHHARVINLSLGGGEAAGADPVEEAAVEDAIDAGVVVVAAAGNESAGTLDFPAAYDRVISVGASALADVQSGVFGTATEYVASYSNWAPALTLVAPGGDPSSALDADPLHWIENIYTTTPASGQSACSDSKNCRAQLAGTSQATPHVASAVALLISMRPSLTPAQVRTLLQSSADDLHDPHQGAGRLNVARAAAALSGVRTTPAASNLVAFAYAFPMASAAPAILDTYYQAGVRVENDGTFRIADVDPHFQGTFKIGLWLDANADGIVDAGDSFGSSAATCRGGEQCRIEPVIVVRAVTGTGAP
jgi:subtilisin family serine protease